MTVAASEAQKIALAITQSIKMEELPLHLQGYDLSLWSVDDRKRYQHIHDTTKQKLEEDACREHDWFEMCRSKGTITRAGRKYEFYSREKYIMCAKCKKRVLLPMQCVMCGYLSQHKSILCERCNKF